MRKRKFIKKRMKNFLLKGVTYLSIILWSVSGCCMDSENFIFFLLIMALCVTWLFLFLVANE